MNAPLKSEIQAYWNARPCGSKFTAAAPGSADFFAGVESFRYRLEPHILEMVEFGTLAGKRVVEVGCGLGTDAVRFAAAGAEYCGVDLSERSISLARKNLKQRGLAGQFLVGDGEVLPLADESVDFVYSHGVLHHTPDIRKAIREVHRILRPGGRATIMLYHRDSWNYRVDISILRRLGALLLMTDTGTKLARKLSGEEMGRLRIHAEQMRSRGIAYLFQKSWLDNNTDGAGNPYSTVYSRAEARELFAPFARVRTQVRFLHAEKLPVVGKRIPRPIEKYLGRKVGWHLYVLAEK